jgi:class 3 adenylate cyclase/tetratricopeptide (TPR) repeat protein
MSAPPREVRKTVTILFCDLVHSTGLAEGDPEAYRRVQTRFFERMQQIVERHGGTVEKFIGDEVMAVFGIPAVHEDDALRAVFAAREMQEALPDLGLRARIGINTGEVLAGDPSASLGLVAGEPVIVAKRLEQGAAPGEIVIGKATYALVEHAVSAGPLERIPVKGKVEDVGRRRVDEVDRDAPSMARRLDLPLVGRDEELRLLCDAFERAAEERSCRVVTVLGEAGIGKSRLAAELATILSGRATTAFGRCLPYGEGITFWPLAEILAELGDLRNALGDDAELVLDLLGGLTGDSEASASTEEAFWAVRRALEASARQRPLVVCLEDLHWAEPTLLDLVEYIVGWSRDAPILVVCLARPELVERRPSLIAPHANVDAIALEPLSAEQIATLLDRLSAELDPSERERIGVAAEGNPLFVEQMAAMATENGDGELAIPPSIHALLAQRLDRLSRDERGIIERSAVIGRDFSLAAVASLSPHDERGSLGHHLLALVRKGFVRPDLRSLREDRFSFDHVLIRDAAYGAMPKELRAELHERLADWAGEGAAPELEELVAYHLEQAHTLRTEVGMRDDGLALRAGRALASAGERAVTREDVPAARSLLRRALAVLPEADPERPALLLDLATVLMRAGDLDGAGIALEQAHAGAADDRPLELRIEIEQALHRAFVQPEGSAVDMHELAASAIPELERFGDDGGLARAWTLVADEHLVACRWGERAKALERALGYAQRAGDRRLRAALIGYLGQTLFYGPTPVDEAIERCEELRATAPEDRTVEAGMLSTLAGLYAMRGDFARARPALARGYAIYEELGLLHRRAIRRLIEAAIEQLAGDAEAAVEALRAGYAEFTQIGDLGARSTMAAYLADALCVAGRYDEAERYAGIAAELAASDDLVTQVLWRCARAKALAHRGEREEADSLAAEAIELAAPTDFLDLQATAFLTRAETVGEGTQAQALVELARDRLERKGNVAALARLG